MVDKRFAVTDLVLRTLDFESKKWNIPVFHGIRTDQAINRASSSNQFLQDWEPRSKAVEDYQAVYKELTNYLLTSDEASQ